MIVAPQTLRPADTTNSDFLTGMLQDMTVRHGPFRGLRYPSAEAAGSALIPKLLGTYESELHDEFYNLLANKKFDTVIDIGAAEGYYAVGLALTLPKAQIIAVDTDKRARKLLKRMAKLNNVAQRIHTLSSIDEKTLKKFDLNKQTLVISDCEGYELTLFTRSVIDILNTATLIIEVHDFINPYISKILQDRLAKTHSISKIESIDDLKKSQTYEVPELDGYDLFARKKFLAEQRPTIMEWIIAYPRAL